MTQANATSLNPYNFSLTFTDNLDIEAATLLGRCRPGHSPRRRPADHGDRRLDQGRWRRRTPSVMPAASSSPTRSPPPAASGPPASNGTVLADPGRPPCHRPCGQRGRHRERWERSRSQSAIKSRPSPSTSFTPTSTGFTATFAEPFNLAPLNLYSTAAANLGPADVTLVGASTGPVRGSLIVTPGNQTITFVKTGGVLAPDTYTVDLPLGRQRLHRHLRRPA